MLRHFFSILHHLSQFYVQLPLLYTVWSNAYSEIGPEVTLWPLETSCAKDYKGHSLVQTSFTEPPNTASISSMAVELKQPWQSDHTCHLRKKFSLQPKLKSEMGSKTQTGMCQCWTYENSCGWKLRVRGNHRIDRLAGKAIITSSLRLRMSEILRSLKHKGIKPRPSHYRPPEGERCREMKRSEISLEAEKTRGGHRQYEHCFKGRVGETSERIWAFSSA